jgi:membrane protease subunit HflK
MADTSYSPEQMPEIETPIDAGSQALAEALRSSFRIVRAVMVVLVLVFLASGFFTVGPQERAMILRLGRPVGEGEKALLGPGLHWSLPYPIDEFIKVPITQLQEVKSTVGWFAVTPEQELNKIEPPAGNTLNPAIDGYVLTADGNIIHSRATLHYRIEDPVRYVFGFTNASYAVQNALNNALLQCAARFKVDDILTRDVIGFREAVRNRTKDLLEERKLGVVVEQCEVESRPPRQLKAAFDNVLKAEVERNKVLNDARTYQNQVLSRAGAEASSRINLAQSERSRLVNEVSSRADQFKQLLPKYQENPALFVHQRWNETMGRILTNVQDKIFVAESAPGKPRQLRLLLNREPPKPKTEEIK